ncbi:MAG: hypothetical protein GX772_12775 [Alcaligenaceae bacterium]|nr:hypothetical protein [Alcaligenaceae bacterium]
MRILPFLYGCKALATLLLVCGPAHASADENWPTTPKFIELSTPYGTLTVSESEYVYEAQLKLDGGQIDPPISGMLSLNYSFEMPDRQATLISISSGNNACPIMYRWMVMRADSYSISPAFGSCSEQIRVSADAKTLTLQTPNQESPEKIDTYVYDGKNLQVR